MLFVEVVDKAFLIMLHSYLTLLVQTQLGALDKKATKQERNKHTIHRDTCATKVFMKVR